MPVRRKYSIKKAVGMAVSAKNVIWTSAKGAQDQYLELLESGTFSDTQIRCGKRIWKVHKAILCIRSEWFKKALTGQFMEAENGIVNIKEFKENEVDCLLQYIYTGSVNVSKNFTAPIGLHACMSIWRVGDFFLLEDLCKLALDEADRTFRGLSWMFTPWATAEFSKQSATSNIVKVIRALYNQGRSDVCDAFKHTILAFLVSGFHVLKKNPTFQDLLYEIPAFASDWALMLTDNMTLITSTNHPEECAKCSSPRHRSIAMRTNWVQGQKVEGFCGTCFPIQQLEDWVGEDSGNT